MRTGFSSFVFRCVLRWAWLAALGLPAAATDQERLELTVGASAAIDSPSDISRISTSAPEVVDAVAVSRREVLLQAKGAGFSTVVIWSNSGERRFYAVTVSQNLEPVRKLLRETFPGEQIDVQAARDALSLTGRVSTQSVAERASALVAPLAKSVVNNLEVAGPGADPQILLRVRFAELDRTVASSLGFNLISTGAFNTPARTTTGQFPAPFPIQMNTPYDDKKGLSGIIPGGNSGYFSNFSISDALNVFAFRPDLNVGAFIQALRTQGVLQILAEPNLVATDGKEASFLVGGEFPVPVVQGGAGVGAVTVMFREFGIRLTFTPRITGHKTIKMHVRPEVSTLDPAAGVVLSGFTIPGLATRRMETHVELAEGQSFVIAGLIDDRATENLAKVPGLANIPILGALFRSRQENKTKTELVVMVTPEITRPVATAEIKAGPVMPNAFLPPLVEAGGQPAEKGEQPAGKKP